MSAQPESAQWPRLSAPVFPDETLICMRAQSALSGPELGQVHDLTVEQARDVLAWYAPKHCPLSRASRADEGGLNSEQRR